ncbi:hypothetical protein QBC35DRAFT_493320 [Podospora australis]|uniref:R3H-associated N-terminal domain-containing protein n=1 Tax=Podospora australis TaxID=1536484 RepID=A0AAN7AI47_9PEZI|nr:hypothetical protein QBC35DRAFT_493320 [Podospora australis]
MAITQNPQPAASDDGSVSVVDHPQPQPAPQPSHQHTISNASTATVDIEAWTVAALESLNITSSSTTGISRGTTQPLSIPLDDSPTSAQPRKIRFDNGITPPRPSRRDSPKKRQDRKPKEGSRHRRRWENDHLLHVPNVQPPSAADFLIKPTYPVLPTVPYQLASVWDRGLRDTVENRRHRASSHTAVPELGHVPRDLRATAKRTPAVKSWLKVLEEPVRQFVVDRGLAITAEQENDSDETDPEDEEIVFVGRAGRQTRDGKPFKNASVVVRKKEDTAELKGMVLDTVDDEEAGGAFRRWLTHSISDYYGLDSKSVVVGNPARKVIFVGVKQHQHQHQHQQQQEPKPPRTQQECLPILPPPLWEMF